jgi:hypothetical protein
MSASARLAHKAAPFLPEAMPVLRDGLARSVELALEGGRDSGTSIASIRHCATSSRRIGRGAIGDPARRRTAIHETCSALDSPARKPLARRSFADPG